MKELGKIIFEHATNNVRGEYSNYSKAEREEAINKAFFEAIGMPQGFTNKKEFRKAMRKNETAMFEIIEEIIDGIANDVNARDVFADMFFEERFLDLGDTNEFYAEGGDELEVVEYSGAHWDVERQRVDAFESFTVTPKSYIISVYEYVDRIVSGRADWTYLVSKVAEAIAKKKRDLVYTTLSSALSVDTVNNNKPFQYTGSYNEREILSVIAHVEAGNGQKPILVGTKTALARLSGLQTHVQHSESLTNEKNSKGYITTWMGYDCIEITNTLGSTVTGAGAQDQLTLPKDEIYIVSPGEKFVKIVNEGAEVSRERTGEQMADRSQELTVIFRCGVAVVYNSYVGFVKINAA